MERKHIKALFTVLILIVIALHQDIWFWTNKTLVFGFLPIGLAYQAGYSMLAALTMALLVRYLWPAHLEEANYYTLPEDATNAAVNEAR